MTERTIDPRLLERAKDCPICCRVVTGIRHGADPVETLVAGLLAASESNQVAVQLAEAAMRRDPTPNNYAGFVPCDNPGGTHDR
jgi:hypothetical protein